MRTVFIHGEVDQFATAKDALSERFRSWCADDPVVTTSSLVELLLEDKFARDGLLARWTEADLTRFLTEVVPRRLAWDHGWSEVPRFLHRWLDFLSAAELLTTGPLSDLHAEVDRATPAFLSAMADPGEWSALKFWAGTMREHGVDTEDAEAVDGFFDAVAEGEIAIDDSLADSIEDRDASESTEDEYAYWLPPIATPDGKAEDARAESALLTTMRGLVDWSRAGRQLGTDGELAESDVDSLWKSIGDADAEPDVLVEWAKHVGLLRIAGDRLVSTQVSTGLLEQPNLLWTRLWQSFVLLDDALGADEWGEDALANLVQETLNTLYSHNEAISLERLADLATAAVTEEADARDEVRQLLRRVLQQWEALDVIRCFVTSDPEQIALIDAAVSDETTSDHTMVELAPEGVSAVRGSLEAFGFTAPTVDDLVEMPAEVLALAIGMGSDEVAEEAANQWIEDRGAADASAELVSVLRRVDDPAVRLAVLWVLEQAGAEGVAAVGGLVEDPIAGPAARVWLGSVADAPPEPRADDDVLFSLDAMAVEIATDVRDFLGEFDQQSSAEQIALLERIAGVRHSHAEAVLAAITANHSDDRVAGAAQRALEQVRSG